MNDNFTYEDTTRKNDCAIEKICADYVDAYWLSKGDYAYERIHDISRQIRGADVILNRPSHLVIDEKVKIDSSGKRGLLDRILSYPSFELLCKNTTGRYDLGWLLKGDSITTHYAFISVFSSVDDYHDLSFDNIDRIIYSLIDKQKLLNVIEKYTGMTTDDLKAKAHSLSMKYNPFRYYDSQEIKTELTEVFFKDNHGKAIYQTLRPKRKDKPEVPVNLVVRRDLLLKEGVVKDIEISSTRVCFHQFSKEHESAPYLY